MTRQHRKTKLPYATIIAATLLLSVHIAHPFCGHDTFLEKNETDLRSRQAQRYEERGRSSQINKLRIVAYPVFTTLTSEQRSIVNDQVMPKAIALLSDMLYVKPVVGNLGVPRPCMSWWTTNGKCAEYESIPKCGNAVIPSSHYAEQQLCRNSPFICETLPGGTGVENADIIIYVTDTSAYCGSSTLAYASHCSRDQNDRPISGHSNICPLMMSQGYSVDDMVTVIIHEITHALSFSSSHYAFYRYADGTPRTPRDSAGYPPWDSV
eukprot:TRINITY_DN7057_c0_g1_i1.p1 TRINITY_DN7057_c0_g1~~TRINITY_DN7057_c0_g1_i1.p1  ORF type:complete len:266 (-),score=37.98 TRINITY_DN7057_c0_g1_i1:79-876(-)